MLERSKVKEKDARQVLGTLILFLVTWCYFFKTMYNGTIFVIS